MPITNDPLKPTSEELREIYKVIGEYWGNTSPDEFAEWLGRIYAVKFKFSSESPGYVGDLFIVHGSVLAGDPPCILIRDSDGKIRETS